MLWIELSEITGTVNYYSTAQNMYMHVNPLSPNSDQHQFSPNNIYTMSRDNVMRINKMITLEKMP